MSNFLDFLVGHKGRVEQTPLFNQQQQGAFGNLLSQGMQNSDFGGIENRARKQFNETTIPGIAERFTAMGTGGSQRSSGFQNSLGRAGSDLESQLGALRSQYGMQQMHMGLTPQFENSYRPSQGGFLQSLLAGNGSQGSGLDLNTIMSLISKMATGGA